MMAPYFQVPVKNDLALRMSVWLQAHGYGGWKECLYAPTQAIPITFSRNVGSNEDSVLPAAP